VVHGEIFRGHSGFAGEFSHIPTSEKGKLCSCGKTGCLETDASLLVVVENAKEGIANGRISSLKNDFENQDIPAGDIVLQAANKGDQYAIELLSESGYAIGKGLAMLIHIMNPEKIVLSGRGAVAGKIFLASIQQALHTYVIPRLAENTTIEISSLGYDAQIIGAACLVMEKITKDSE
jgi:predicted NBD/HSP70 family sugar kinase